MANETPADNSNSQTATATPHIDPATQKHLDLAALNTRFGAERTLMAAVRTSLSLIGFGFTIYKFFESIVHTMGAGAPVRSTAPQRLGLTLVSIGVFVLVAFSWQHWFFLKELRKETTQQFPRSISLVTAILLAITGIVLFVTIVARR